MEEEEEEEEEEDDDDFELYLVMRERTEVPEGILCPV